MHFQLVFTFFFFTTTLLANTVSVRLEGQFGNQLFQIATAYAYALDYDLTLTIPDLVHKRKDNIPYNANKLFLNKINSFTPKPPQLIWKERPFKYGKIPKVSSIELKGYFQSEKYFIHRRKEILDLFEPSPSLKKVILEKYPILESNALVVGIQVRDYRKESPDGSSYPTLTRNYYEQAITYFPQDTIFLISSNNPTYAKSCLDGLHQNLIYLKGEDYIEEFYTLTLCNSFIISNSTFGWWASWLSTHPDKLVIAPYTWFSYPLNNETMRKDLLPPQYIAIAF